MPVLDDYENRHEQGPPLQWVVSVDPMLTTCQLNRLPMDQI
jgi:hypothetical protein